MQTNSVLRTILETLNLQLGFWQWIFDVNLIFDVFSQFSSQTFVLTGGTIGTPHQILVLRHPNAGEMLCMTWDEKSVRKESGNLEDDEYFGIFRTVMRRCSVGPGEAMRSAV